MDFFFNSYYFQHFQQCCGDFWKSVSRKHFVSFSWQTFWWGEEISFSSQCTVSPLSMKSLLLFAVSPGEGSAVPCSPCWMLSFNCSWFKVPLLEIKQNRGNDGILLEIWALNSHTEPCLGCPYNFLLWWAHYQLDDNDVFLDFIFCSQLFSACYEEEQQFLQSWIMLCAVLHFQWLNQTERQLKMHHIPHPSSVRLGKCLLQLPEDCHVTLKWVICTALKVVLHTLKKFGALLKKHLMCFVMLK